MQDTHLVSPAEHLLEQIGLVVEVECEEEGVDADEDGDDDVEYRVRHPLVDDELDGEPLVGLGGAAAETAARLAAWLAAPHDVHPLQLRLRLCHTSNHTQ